MWVAFIGARLDLIFSGGSYANNSTVKIFDFTTYAGSGFTTVNSTGLAPTQTATFDSTNGIVTVVPEPSTIVMLLSGMGMLIGFRRFRRS